MKTVIGYQMRIKLCIHRLLISLIEFFISLNVFLIYITKSILFVDINYSH